MTKMVIGYLGDLRTESTHLQSKTEILTDAPIDNQGKGEKFSPTDLFCSSLASCMLTIMGIKGRGQNIDITGVSIEIEKVMQSSPRKVSEIKMKFNWIKKYNQAEQTLLKDAALNCPVALSIDPSILKTIDWGF